MFFNACVLRSPCTRFSVRLERITLLLLLCKMSLETGKPCLSVTGLYLDVSVVLHRQNINRWSRQAGIMEYLIGRMDRQKRRTVRNMRNTGRTDRQTGRKNKQITHLADKLTNRWDMQISDRRLE